MEAKKSGRYESKHEDGDLESLNDRLTADLRGHIHQISNHPVSARERRAPRREIRGAGRAGSEPTRSCWCLRAAGAALRRCCRSSGTTSPVSWVGSTKSRTRCVRAAAARANARARARARERERAPPLNLASSLSRARVCARAGGEAAEGQEERHALGDGGARAPVRREPARARSLLSDTHYDRALSRPLVVRRRPPPPSPPPRARARAPRPQVYFGGREAERVPAHARRLHDLPAQQPLAHGGAAGQDGRVREGARPGAAQHVEARRGAPDDRPPAPARAHHRSPQSGARDATRRAATRSRRSSTHRLARARGPRVVRVCV